MAEENKEAEEEAPKPWLAVESSRIKQVRHQKGRLDIVFNRPDDVMYSYPDVPEMVYREMLAAESLGQFFEEHILGRVFEKSPFEKP